MSLEIGATSMPNSSDGPPKSVLFGPAGSTLSDDEPTEKGDASDFHDFPTRITHAAPHAMSESEIQTFSGGTGSRDEIPSLASMAASEIRRAGPGRSGGDDDPFFDPAPDAPGPSGEFNAESITGG